MNSEENKKFEKETYKRTANSLEGVVKSSPTYTEIMRSFAVGDLNVKFRKRFLLKKIDELWINAIEDALPSLDQIIRNPQFRLQEKEEVLPVEISKHINGRSVVHLSQHTNLINEIKDDGTVVPSKLLNVFQEDTFLTYENKFINTLINRLYAFILVRYNGAEECGEDEKNTSIEMEQQFEHLDYKGKISLNIEISQDPEEHEVVKNYIYTGDLWKRVKRLYGIVSQYMSSSFVQNMGKNFVHPPIMRTNTILKNPLFKDCLTLWEFIESYENTGYETLVQEDILNAPNKLLEDMYNSIAEQYVIFQTHINNEYEQEKSLDSRIVNINPKIQEELDDFDEDEYDYKTTIPDILTDELPLEEPDNSIEYALLVALAADTMLLEEEGDVEDEQEPNYSTVIDDKTGEILYKYKYSFLARLIKAQCPTQDYYNEIKNTILSYEGIKTFLSWNRELFKHGRTPCVKLNCKGKTLFVYLPLNPKEFDASHYHHIDVSEEGKENDEYPFLLKVRSRRACKYAKELIALVMERNNIALDSEFKEKDYHIGPMTIDELLEKDLARLIDDKSSAMPDLDEGEVPAIEAPEVKTEEPKTEEQPLVEEPKDDLTLKESISEAKESTTSLSIGKEVVAKYLSDKYGDKVIINTRENMTSTGLPLADTHYLYIGETKKCFIYIYDIDGSVFFIVRGNETIAENIKKLNHKFPSSAFPKTRDYAKWYTMIIDDSYDTNESVFEALDIVVSGLLGNDILVKPAIVKEEPKSIEVLPEPVIAESEDKFDSDQINRRFRFSFQARIILSGAERQDLYNAVKNNILSYKKVNNKISWGHELFKLGRIKLAVLKVKGKTLCVYLPLDPDKYDKDRLFFKDERIDGKEVEFPMMMKVKSDRAVKYVAELISDVMANNGIILNENYVEQDYRFKEMSISEMLKCDPALAKNIEVDEVPVFLKKRIFKAEEPLNEEIDITETISDQQASDDEIVAHEEVAEEPLIVEKTKEEMEADLVDEEVALVAEETIEEAADVEQKLEEATNEKEETTEEPVFEETVVEKEKSVEAEIKAEKLEEINIRDEKEENEFKAETSLKSAEIIEDYEEAVVVAESQQEEKNTPSIIVESYDDDEDIQIQTELEKEIFDGNDDTSLLSRLMGGKYK